MTDCEIRGLKKHRKFAFETFHLDREARHIELHYSLDGEVRFTETLVLPADRPLAPDSEALAAALSILHLIGGVSYYKTCLPPELEIRTGGLTPHQARFFEQVYERGLGEFFYRNRIDFRGLIRFPSSAEAAPPTPTPRSPSQRALIPIGGGKDSLVSAELAKAAGLDATLFRMGKHPLIEESARIARLPLLTVERRLSPALFELNDQGALNGHVPITAYVSALTIVLSLLYGFDVVAFSNERSASEGNIEYLGLEVNHQWSKGLDFELAFRDYLRRYVTSDVCYVSLLRPLSELRIAQIFAAHPEYFPASTSCNANWRILGTGLDTGQLWCGTCPKCAFCFALYAAFLPQETLVGIFGGDLFDRPELLSLYRRLLGTEGFKPFECVGTTDETRSAFYLALRRGDLSESAAMRYFATDVLPSIPNPDGLVECCLTPSDEHALPESLARVAGAPAGRHAD